MPSENQRIASHYRALFQEHGDSPLAVQWFDSKTQFKRFEVLCEIADLDTASILDFGCGPGHLARFLDICGITVRYTGVDIVPQVLDHARSQYPGRRFCTWDELGQDTFDYVLISGVFNNKRRDNERFYRQTLLECFSRARRGMAFNMLSRYSSGRGSDLFYVRPEEVYHFARNHLSPLVTLRNDYRVRDDLEAFDFSVYVYREKG